MVQGEKKHGMKYNALLRTNRLRKNSPHHEEVAGIRSESFDGAQSLP